MKKRIVKFSLLFPVLIFAGYGMIAGFGGTACLHSSADVDSNNSFENANAIDKKDIRNIIDYEALMNLEESHFSINYEGLRYQVNTSLDIPLQQYLIRHLDQANSRFIGIVAMDPSTGRILSMVGFDKTDISNNPCTENQFPAASIFKIITAAAAIETCGFNFDTKFAFNGGKYTLYKSQLKERENKYTNYITFQDSFAESVNPVFGKIGANYLGKDYLEKYGNAFGFNHFIEFELPITPSSLFITDESYQWAEIACGFNRETVISPLHGVLLSATILNHGRMIEPTIVDQITNAFGQTLYQGRLSTINQAISPGTSDEVKKMMNATIRSGTSRDAFKGYQKDPVLCRLNMGGKTGSICSSENYDIRYDWFVGYAEEKEGLEKLAVSVVVAHEKYIGKRASEYARMTMKKYFQEIL